MGHDRDAPTAVSGRDPTRRPPPDPIPGRPGSLRAAPWVGATAVVLSLALDQATKLFAIRILESGPVDLGLLRFRLVANRGVLMGFPAPTTVVVLVTLVIVAVAVRESRLPGPRRALAYGLIAGGALGNLVDRLLQRDLFPAHAVVDWISLRGLMTFNLADVFVVVGAALLIGGARSPVAAVPHPTGKDGRRDP